MEKEILSTINSILKDRTHQPLPSPTTKTLPPSTIATATTASLPKLGAAYNIFDGEELLEQSIRSIRPLVSYVVVVYQTRSNFNEPCSSTLVSTLKRLRDVESLIDELIEYTPRFNFTKDEKKHWVSARATGNDLGGARYYDVADPFFNELIKREEGRLKCLQNNCTHFMCMDTDEYYKRSDLTTIWQRMRSENYDVAACKMRFFFKFPRCELYPYDENNYVTAIYKLSKDMPLRLGKYYKRRERASRIWKAL